MGLVSACSIRRKELGLVKCDEETNGLAFTIGTYSHAGTTETAGSPPSDARPLLKLAALRNNRKLSRKSQVLNKPDCHSASSEFHVIMSASKDLFQQGLKNRREVVGDSYVDRALQNGSGEFGFAGQQLVTE